SARVGFEMSLLRMLAFRPAEGGASAAGSGGGTGRAGTAQDGGGRSAAAAARAALGAVPAPVAASPPPVASPTPTPAAATGHPAAKPVQVASPLRPTAPASMPPAMSASGADAPPWPMAEAQATAPGVDAASWPDFVAGLQLRGPVRELAASSAFIAHGDGVLRLSLPESDDHLRAPFLVRQFADALGATWGSAPDIRFEAGAVASDTLHARNERVRDERQGRAETAFHDDPHVRRLMEQGARVVPDSIRPIQEQEH